MTNFLQKLTDPLCKLQGGVMTPADMKTSQSAYARFRSKYPAYSEALNTFPGTYEGYTLWLDLAKKHGFEPTEAEDQATWGKAPPLAFVGRFFAYGTECPCCLGWRVAVALVAGLLIGKLLM